MIELDETVHNSDGNFHSVPVLLVTGVDYLTGEENRTTIDVVQVNADAWLKLLNTSKIQHVCGTYYKVAPEALMVLGIYEEGKKLIVRVVSNPDEDPKQHISLAVFYN